MTTNLKEAFDPADVADPDDMRIYVRRLLDQSPHVPDVLLLQEVRRESASTVARLMTEQSGETFRVAVRPGEPPWIERDGRIFDWETAIVINSGTVEIVGDTGYIVTRYPLRVAAAGEPPRVRHHAFATLRKRDGSATASVASVHYVQKDFFLSESTAQEYKKRWVVKTARALEAEAAEYDGDMTAIGGDYNASRGTRDEFANHTHSPWLLAITGEPHYYLDTVYEVTKEGGPDFIFARAGIVDAGLDWEYNQRLAQKDGGFYSDHRFRWALIYGPAPK